LWYAGLGDMAKDQEADRRLRVDDGVLEEADEVRPEVRLQVGPAHARERDLPDDREGQGGPGPHREGAAEGRIPFHSKADHIAGDEWLAGLLGAQRGGAGDDTEQQAHGAPRHRHATVTLCARLRGRSATRAGSTDERGARSVSG